MSTTDFTLLKSTRTQPEMYRAYLLARRAILREYTNEDDSDPGNALVQILLGVVDYLHLRHDLESIQSIVDRVERRESARSILQAYGTDLAPKGTAQASVTVTITGNTLPSSDIPIQRYHAFHAPGVGKRFVVIEPGLTWSAGADSMTLPVVEGTLRTESLREGSGRESQVLYSTIPDIIQNDLVKTVIFRVDGLAWDVVPDWANSGPTDTHVLFQYLGSGRGRFVLGNNRLGLVPEEGAEFTLECLSGGGTEGNVGPGEITDMLTPLTENGNSFAVDVTNAAAASGGRSEQTVREAMTINPSWWRAQDRCGPRPDVVALARKVPGVLDAYAERTGVTVVTTFVLGDSDDGYASDELLRSVDVYLTERAMMTDDHNTSRPTYVPVNIDVAIRTKKKAVWTRVKSEVEALIQDFLDLQSRKLNGEVLFGQPDGSGGHRYTSDLIGQIEVVNGVDSVDLTRFTREPQVILGEWSGSAVIGPLNVTNDTVDEDIVITFINTTSFTVVGSVSGELGIGEVGSPFSDRNGQIGFTVSNSGTAMTTGDYATMRVSNLVANVKLKAGEVAILGDFNVSQVT